MTVCTLILSSCEKVEVQQIGVSAKSELLGGKTNMSTFISVKCEGAWTLTLEFEDAQDHWASLDATSGTGSRNSILLTADANTSIVRRSLNVVLTDGVSKATCRITQKAAGEDVEEGGQQGGDSDEPESTTGNTALSKTGWLELPAMDNPDLGYYSHSFKMNGNTYRNYTFGWSQKDMVAVWVAYPLCKMYSNGSVKRDDAEVWALDPHLGNDSSAPFGGYGGDYDRGHQLPFADRKCCLEAAKQTFYGTNMTPQDNGLNTGVWGALESKVRGWAASSDTTYVVTGCTLDKPLGYTTDSYGKKMTVPSGYFKAILKYSKSSTFGQWNAAGFYYKHESGAKQQMMSIDQLEEMTGIDFFVNLSAKIGADQAAKIEAADPADSSVWW